MNLVKKDRDEDIAVKLLIEAIDLKYGYDFRDYAAMSIRRRIIRAVERFELPSIGDMQSLLLKDSLFFSRLLAELTVTVSEMFRNPEFFRQLVDEIFPILATYPSIRIWHAGCSSGEEVYSTAILLKEAGLLERSTIYATDINPIALERANTAVYASELITAAESSYRSAGGVGLLSDYFMQGYDGSILDHKLRSQIVFAEHNLASDEVFSEVHLILCRNVMIYFNQKMQNRAVRIFQESLINKGFLGLGQKETIEYTSYNAAFRQVRMHAPIYQKSVEG